MKLNIDKNLIETMNQQKGEIEKLNDKIQLLETRNKILTDHIANKQKLIVSSLQHNNALITQQERLLNTGKKCNTCT